MDDSGGARHGLGVAFAQDRLPIVNYAPRTCATDRYTVVSGNRFTARSTGHTRFRPFSDPASSAVFLAKASRLSLIARFMVSMFS